MIQVNESAPNGDVIDSVTMTPYEVSIDYGFDESKVEAAYEKFDSLQSVMIDAGSFSPAGYDLSKITIYYYPAPTEAVHDEIREKLYDESFKDQIVSYMEEISVRKIEIDLDGYYQN